MYIIESRLFINSFSSENNYDVLEIFIWIVHEQLYSLINDKLDDQLMIEFYNKTS